MLDVVNQLKFNSYFRNRYVTSKEANQELKSNIANFELERTWSENTVDDLPKLYIEDSCVNFVTVVPILKKNVTARFDYPEYVIIYMIAVAALTIIAKGTMKASNKITRLRKNKSVVLQKLFIPCYVCLFATFTAELYSDIVDVKAIYEEIPFESFKEVNESSLKIRSYAEYIPINIRSSTDPYFSSLAKRTVAAFYLVSAVNTSTADIETIDFCFNDLKKSRDVVCLSEENLARLRFTQTSFNRPPTMKIPTGSPKHFTQFEAGSPLVDKFQLLINRRVEAGLNVYYLKKNQREYKDRRFNSWLKDKVILNMKNVFYFFIFGYTLVLLIFLYEITDYFEIVMSEDD